MGRHHHEKDDDADDDKDREEERLLRKAKEYISSQQQQQQKDNDGRGDRKHSHRRDHDDKHERRSRHHRRDEDDDSRGRSRKDDDDRKKRRRKEEEKDLDDDRDKRKRRKSDRDDRKRSSRDHGDDSRRRHRRDDDDEDSRRRQSKKKRHRDRSPSDDEESRGRKRHASSRKHHHRREEKKDKRKKSSKSKNHDSSSSRKKKSSINKNRNLIPLGEPVGHAPEQLIDPVRDYFQFHQHLWVYLFRQEGVMFNDLASTAETRQAFERFAAAYNAGELEVAYYQESLPANVLEECQTTRHNWSLKLSSAEDNSLHALQAGVRRQTEYRVEKEGPPAGAQQPVSPAARGGGTNSSHQEHHRHDDSRGHKQPRDRVAERLAHRRLKEHVRTAEEEFSGGRKEGRERQIEKRRELADKIHGAARDKEAATELTDDALYGEEAGSSSFQQALQREKARTARRQEQRTNRVAELEQKEKDKQQAMLEALGLAGSIRPGQKITIAPRKDG